jgi:hypothetical protein
MSAKNISSEKMNTSGMTGGRSGETRRVMTPQPNNVQAKGPKGGKMAMPKKGGTGKPG